MKVSIVTEGFQNTGYGHITRCLSLGQAFSKRGIGFTIYVNGDENSKPFFSLYNYKIIDWLAHPSKLIKEISRSDILIFDSYLAGKEYYNNFSKVCAISLFIDDNLRIDYPDGIILNGTINAESFPYKHNSSQIYLLGTKYIPLREDFWNIPAKKINPKVRSMLITFGGQDQKKLTIPALNALNEAFPDILKNVVIGSGFANQKTFEKFERDKVKIKFSPSSHEMCALMTKCDIAVSAAGQTLYELAAAGTPTIAIAVAENQKNNIYEWKKKGFLLDTIFQTDVNYLKKIITKTKLMESITVRKKMCGIGKDNVDGKGAVRVIDSLISKHCQPTGFYLRNAANADSKTVFELSNDPDVRVNSINKGSIDWSSHQEWYDEILGRKNYIFLLAFDKNDNFIGQVRFEIKDTTAVVSISLRKIFRGKGLSKKILKEACAKIFLEESVADITAYIQPNNLASIKGFGSAGFIRNGEEKILSENYLKFILSR
jgi:UDP-2,4-diacetamido-2,4,6-trideoxy-beta-L-altropyranose hydrolase